MEGREVEEELGACWLVYEVDIVGVEGWKEERMEG